MLKNHDVFLFLTVEGQDDENVLILLTHGALTHKIYTDVMCL